MRRREFMLILGGAMTMPLPLRAQQKAMPVIGFLGSTSPDLYAAHVAAFHQGLNETGYDKTSRSNTAGRRVIMIGLQHWPPISSAARSMLSPQAAPLRRGPQRTRRRQSRSSVPVVATRSRPA